MQLLQLISLIDWWWAIRTEFVDQINASTVTYGKKIRVCLVGDVINDASTVLAAQSFAVPVVQSSNGLDLPDEHAWQTCYILDDFDGPMFETLNKNKQWYHWIK